MFLGSKFIVNECTMYIILGTNELKKTNLTK